MARIYSPEKFAYMGDFHPCVLWKRKQVIDLTEMDGHIMEMEGYVYLCCHFT